MVIPASPGSPTPKAKLQKPRGKKPPISPSPKTFRSARLQQKHERTLARPDSSSQSKIEGIPTASPVSAIKINRGALTSARQQDPKDTGVPSSKKRAQSKGEFSTRLACSPPYEFSMTAIAGITSTNAMDTSSSTQELSKPSLSIPPPITPPRKKKQAGRNELDLGLSRDAGTSVKGTTVSSSQETFTNNLTPAKAEVSHIDRRQTVEDALVAPGEGGGTQYAEHTVIVQTSSSSPNNIARSEGRLPSLSSPFSQPSALVGATSKRGTFIRTASATSALIEVDVYPTFHSKGPVNSAIPLAKLLSINAPTGAVHRPTDALLDPADIPANRLASGLENPPAAILVGAREIPMMKDPSTVLFGSLRIGEADHPANGPVNGLATGIPSPSAKVAVIEQQSVRMDASPSQGNGLPTARDRPLLSVKNGCANDPETGRVDDLETGRANDPETGRANDPGTGNTNILGTGRVSNLVDGLHAISPVVGPQHQGGSTTNALAISVASVTVVSVVAFKPANGNPYIV